MVATRSMRPERPLPKRNKMKESPGSRGSPSPRARRTDEGMKDPEAEPKPLAQDPPRAAKGRGRPPSAQPVEPVTDGEVSEAESTCSYASGLQEPTVRVTRRRRIVIPCQPEAKGRGRRRAARSGSIKSGDEGELSEAESCSSVLSSLLASPVKSRGAPAHREFKFHLDPSSALLAEETSDAESWCSGVSIGGRRSKRRQPKKDAEAPAGGVEEGAEQSAPAPPGDFPVCDGEEAGGRDLNKELYTVEEEKETGCEDPEQGRPSPGAPGQQKAGADRPGRDAAPPPEYEEGSSRSEGAEEVAEEPAEEMAGEMAEEPAEEPAEEMAEDRDRNEPLEGDAPASPPSVSILLALSSDEDQGPEDSEDEEGALCLRESREQREDPPNEAFFVIDKSPGLRSDKNYYIEEEKAGEAASEQEEEEEEEEEEDEEESAEEEPQENPEEFLDEDDMFSSTKASLLKLSSSSIDPGLSIKQLGGLYINFNAEKMDFNKNALTQIKEKNKKELLQKTIITPDFEKKDCIPPYKESQFQLKKKRREERKKTAGDGWFGMKAPELTTELKNDLKALQMRASMDPKRFYKKNDRDGFPKYFQVGTIADNPADFYHSRIPKKQRKRTIVEELLADSEFRRYNKRKYTEIMMEKATNAAGKKFRKKKKFRN